MALYSLPAELLSQICTLIVHDSGIRKAAQLRTVSRSFDQFIQDAIFRLPTFVEEDEGCPPHLYRDLCMSRTIVERLIKTKLHMCKMSSKALIYEIHHTTQFVSTKLRGYDEVLKAKYESALVELAAHALPLRDVVRYLGQPHKKILTVSRLQRNALVAAIHLGRLSDVTLFLETKILDDLKTRFFGNILAVAARSGFLQVFFPLLNVVMDKDTWAQTQLSYSFRMEALCEAAQAGHTVITEALLDTNLHRKNVEYDSAIKSAIRASNSAIAILLLKARYATIEKISDMYGSWLFERSDENEMLCSMLSLAGAFGDLDVVVFLLNHSPTPDQPAGLNSAFEEACRFGNLQIVQLLLQHHSCTTLTDFGPAMFWAARAGYVEILEEIFQSNALITFEMYVDALCGAYSAKRTHLPAVLDLGAKYYSLRTTTRWPSVSGSTKFSSLVRDLSDGGIIWEFLERRGSASKTAFVPEHTQLLEGSTHVILTHTRIQTKWMYQETIPNHEKPRCRRRKTSCTIETAMLARKSPGIFRYAHETFNFTPARRSQALGDSLANHRVLLDCGKTINQVVEIRGDIPYLSNSRAVSVSVRRRPPTGFLPQSERLIRWLVRQGFYLPPETAANITWRFRPPSRATFPILRLLYEHGFDVWGKVFQEFSGQPHGSAAARKLDWALDKEMHVSKSIPFHRTMFSKSQHYEYIVSEVEKRRDW